MMQRIIKIGRKLSDITIPDNKATYDRSDRQRKDSSSLPKYLSNCRSHTTVYREKA